MSNRTSKVVIGIDPGATVGWSLWDGTQAELGQAPAYEALDRIYAWLATGHIDRIACERVDIRRRDNDLKFAVQIEGIVLWLGHVSNTPVSLVNAADRQRTLEDAIGTSGVHAQDADAVRLWDLRYGKW